MRRQPNVLTIGDATTAAMRPVQSALEQCASEGAVPRGAADVPSAVAQCDVGDWDPDLVVVLQNWPDEFPQSHVLRLFASFPLARVVCCGGDWCDSDGRTRSHWPPAVRVAAHAAGPRLRQEIALLRGDPEADAPLPLTAQRDEVFEFTMEREIGPGLATAAVAVVTPDSAWRRCLHDLLVSAGGTIAASPDEPGTAAVLWDADPYGEQTLHPIGAYHAARPWIPVIALLGFPRPSEIEALEHCGAAAVVPKLTPQTELLTVLARLLQNQLDAPGRAVSPNRVA